MKILIVKMAGDIGGAEIYNYNLIRGLKKYYPQTEIYFLTNNSRLAKKISETGIRVFTMHVFHEEVGTKRGLARLVYYLPQYIISFFKVILYLKFIKSVKIAIFQGTTEKIVLTPLLKFLNIRVIWLEHGPLFSTKRSKIIIFLYRLNSHWAEKVIVVSKNTKSDLIEGGIDQCRIAIVRTGIDAEYFKPRVFKKNKVLGYLGAINNEKGATDFISMAKIVHNQDSRARFIMVGSGDLKGKPGYLKVINFQDDVRPLLGQFSIFFFPTRHFEGISLAMLEAMSMGIPIVARDIGGNKELIEDSRTGYLFKDEKPDQIANLLIGLLNNEDKCESMGLLATKKVIREFNYLNWIKKWQKIINAY